MSDTEQTCECGHHVGSHNSLLYNCMATTDGTHDTRCSCRKFAPSPSGEPPAVSDTRILCAVCGIWQCLARHGGGTCHAVNGPSDTSCGACYANRPTIQRDLTVASEEPPACRQRAASLHPRLGLSYACVLTAGHNGECAPGGTCFEHGPYIGKPGTTPRCPKCPSPTFTFVPAAVASPLPEEPPTEQRIAEIQSRMDRATTGPWSHVVIWQDDSQRAAIRGGLVASCGTDNGNAKHYIVPAAWGEWKSSGAAHDAEFIAHANADIAYLLAERSRLAGENAELRTERDAARELVGQTSGMLRSIAQQTERLHPILIEQDKWLPKMSEMWGILCESRSAPRATGERE